MGGGSGSSTSSASLPPLHPPLRPGIARQKAKKSPPTEPIDLRPFRDPADAPTFFDSGPQVEIDLLGSRDHAINFKKPTKAEADFYAAKAGSRKASPVAEGAPSGLLDGPREEGESAFPVPARKFPAGGTSSGSSSKGSGNLQVDSGGAEESQSRAPPIVIPPQAMVALPPEPDVVDRSKESNSPDDDIESDLSVPESIEESIEEEF